MPVKIAVNGFGRLEGLAVGLPIPHVSMVDFSVKGQKSTAAKEVNQAFAAAATGELGKILVISPKPLVSAGYGFYHSTTVYAQFPQVMGGKLVKSWAVNDWAFLTACLIWRFTGPAAWHKLPEERRSL
ncbi:MAG: hypothetical protein JRI59_06330 [Deltaproteobacteria bacterium]|nr:hypothetical protein [Deltaproteobacteria bacterium]